MFEQRGKTEHRQKKKMQVILEVQLILEAESSSLRLVQIPRHISGNRAWEHVCSEEALARTGVQAGCCVL